MFLCLPTAMKVCQSLPSLLEIKKSVQAALGKLNPVHKRLQAPEAYQVCVGLCSSAEASWENPTSTSNPVHMQVSIGISCCSPNPG